MTKRIEASGHDRRAFLKEMAVFSGAAVLGARPGNLMAQVATKWKKQIGIELYTVGALLRKDYEGTLAKLAEMGYTEVEPADPYNNMAPKDYKALLKKYGLKMYSTHSGAKDGPDLEKQLEGQALMGIKYTDVSAPRPPRPPAPAQGARPQRPQRTVESVKLQAERMNKYGRIVKKFGMKILYHNHSQEFDRLEGSELTQYDVLLAETDPSVVVMQIDIGWAAVAGRDVIEMFGKHPGRYELWHVKDATVKNLDPNATPSQRQRAAKIVPMGQGDIDYKAVFAKAKLAGLKYFVIEQDGAGQESGDALADCRVAYQNLYKILS